MEIWAIIMFAVAMVLLLLGYPVAFTLGAIAMLFGGFALGFDFFALLPLRIHNVRVARLVPIDIQGRNGTYHQNKYCKYLPAHGVPMLQGVV